MDVRTQGSNTRMYDAILFPTDGSPGSDTALDHALDIARRFDATLHVLSIADTDRDSATVVRGEVVSALERQSEAAVESVADRARGRGVEVVEEVTRGDPTETILEYAADHDVDLLVMPTHGRRGLDRFLLGSVTEKVVRAADVPVLTIRLDGDEDEN